jgi:hypothetical protein
MKTFTGLLSLAVIGGSLMTGQPARADTAYHPVYERMAAVGDIFSILDKNHNNAILFEDYNAAPNKIAFSTVDADGSGWLSREEFYSHYDLAGNVVSGGAAMTEMRPAAGERTASYHERTETLAEQRREARNGEEMNEVAPAAGDTLYTTTRYRTERTMYRSGEMCDRPTAAINGDDNIYPAACGVE